MSTSSAGAPENKRKWLRAVMAVMAIALVLPMVACTSSPSVEDEVYLVDFEKGDAKSALAEDGLGLFALAMVGEYDVEVFLPNGNTWPETGGVTLKGNDMTIIVSHFADDPLGYTGSFDPETHSFTAVNEYEEVTITFTMVDGRIVGEGHNVTLEDGTTVDYHMTKK